jgi:TatD DNase family protein
MALSQESESSNNNYEHLYVNMILIDTGANLTNKKFSRDLDSVIQRAKDSGVQKIIVHGANVKSSKEALRLTRIYPGIIYSSAGIHPHDSKNVLEDLSSWYEFETIAKQPECVAIGPTGLDYNRDISDPDTQKEIFKKQIQLAIEVKKPLLIHEKSAQEDVLEILSSFPISLPIVVRSFMGTTEEAQRYLDKGYYLALTGFLCKDKSDTGVRKLLEENILPLERLLVETDSPFMYPNTRASKLPVHVKAGLTERSLMFLHRYCTFQRNEPCSLPAIVELLSSFMKKKPEDVSLLIAFNALKIYGLSQ